MLVHHAYYVNRSSGRKDPCPLWSHVCYPWSRQPTYVCICIRELHIPGNQRCNLPFVNHSFRVRSLWSQSFGVDGGWKQTKGHGPCQDWEISLAKLSFCKEVTVEDPNRIQVFVSTVNIFFCWGWRGTKFPISKMCFSGKNKKVMIKNEWWDVCVCEKRRKEIEYSYINKSVWNLSWDSTYISRGSFLANIGNGKYRENPFIPERSARMGREKPNYSSYFLFNLILEWTETIAMDLAIFLSRMSPELSSQLETICDHRRKCSRWHMGVPCCVGSKLF